MTINLYRYDDAIGVVITPEKRNENDTPYCYRLIADDGCVYTNGDTETPCVDTHHPEEWTEIPDQNAMRLPDGIDI